VQRSAITTEKIVAAVLMVVITSVCLWVGSTLTSISHEMIQLQSNVMFQNKTIDGLKVEIKELKDSQYSIGQSNFNQIAILSEKMRQDDTREAHDTVLLEKLEERLIRLEAAWSRAEKKNE